MPLRFQPPSLRKASLRSIASNYDYWCVGQSPSQSDFISPFQDLRDDMIQELIQLLRQQDEQHFEECGIKFVFHPYLRGLHLSWNLNAMNVSSISTLATRCKKLTHLTLGYVQVGAAVLRKLVTNLTQLVSLNISWTHTDRSVLKAVADNCPKLHDLYVQHCPHLENSDFLVLCNLPERPRISIQLTSLTLTEWTYRMSTDTVVALLNTHSNLKSLGFCELIDQALHRMYGKEYQLKKNFQQTWIHNLSEVTIYGCEEEIVDLELTTLCFPYLTTLSLNLADGPIHSLSAVSNLKYLTSLSILGKSEDSSSNTFQNDVVPILYNIGGNLTSLWFHDMYDVCVFRIGELCPNLQSLDLMLSSRSSNSTYNPTTVHQHFSKLRVLDISDISSENPTIPTEALSVILENATEIVEMPFDSVENLTDGIISEANAKHGFRFLTKAWFIDPTLITKKTGMILLSPDNPLNHLYFQDCTNITDEDVDLLKTYAEHQHFNISFDLVTFNT